MSREILQDIKNSRISKSEASDLLISLIENSDNVDFRIDCLKTIGSMGLKNNLVFKVVENCLISDEDVLVKVIAAEVLVNIFLSDSYRALNWTIENEQSILVLTTIFKGLKENQQKLSKSLVKKAIKKFSKIYDIVLEEAKFLLDLYSMAIENVDQIKDNVRNHRFDGGPFQIPKFYNYFLTPRLEIKDKHIISLDIFFWKLKTIPKSISALSKLKYLTLNGDNLALSPEAIDSLKELRWVELSCIPKFKSIPDWILSIVKKCHSRIYLKNGIKEIEAITIGLLDLLSGYELYELGPSQSIHNYSQIYAYRLNKKGNVSELYISNPRKFKLSILPEQIKNLKELTLLDLNSNEIEIIPNSLSFLKSLKYLNLSNNKIKEIPISIGSLTSLEFLDLSGNEIEKLPESFIKLENLRSLKLENNLIDCLPTSMKSTLTFKKRVIVP